MGAEKAQQLRPQPSLESERGEVRPIQHRPDNLLDARGVEVETLSLHDGREGMVEGTDARAGDGLLEVSLRS